mmetsp:Transcript_26434/g.70657  ORF Transcript_26434/g.70657 Transcript_26434/m.70657 type:complete len:203 (-) Transcript_26434:3611-4219(-)
MMAMGGLPRLHFKSAVARWRHAGPIMLPSMGTGRGHHWGAAEETPAHTRMDTLRYAHTPPPYVYKTAPFSSPLSLAGNLPHADRAVRLADGHQVGVVAHEADGGHIGRVAGERDALRGLGDARVAEDPPLPILVADRHQVLVGRAVARGGVGRKRVVGVALDVDGRPDALHRPAVDAAPAEPAHVLELRRQLEVLAIGRGVV